MDRPLWRILLPLFVLSLTVQRAAALTVGVLEALPPILLASLVLQVLAALALAVGLFLGRRWTIGAALLLGVALAATALLQALASGGAALPLSLSQVFAAALGAAGLAWIAHHEFAPEHRASRDAS